MIWVSVSEKLCWGVVEKCASTSMHKSMDEGFFRHVLGLEASKHEIVAACIRDPMERLWSAFNHFYEITFDRLTTKQHKVDYAIKAYGAVLRAGDSYNFTSMNSEKKAEYLTTIAATRLIGESDSALATRLDAIDYMTFVSEVLRSKGTKSEDTHWMPQATQFCFEGKNIITDLYKFENVNEAWSKHFNTNLPKINSHPNINKDIFFRYDELRVYYKEDYKLRSTLQ